MGKTTETTPQADDAEAGTAKKATRKTTAKKRVAKRAAKKPATKKRGAKKTAKKKTAKKRVTKKAAKKATAKKHVAKKAAKKPVAKKPVTKKAAKRPPAKKRASRKTSSAMAPSPAGSRDTTAVAPEPLLSHESGHCLTSQGADRRTDERLDVPGLLEVDVEMFGYQREAREFGIGPVTNASLKIQTFGATVNLSLSGLCALIADPITVGSHCLVRFVNAGSGVRPELRWGLVMRCEEHDTGKFEVGVKFDNPLEHLDADALVAA